MGAPQIGKGLAITVGIVGSAVTVVAFFVPTARDWMDSQSLLGWALFALLLILYPPLFWLLREKQSTLLTRDHSLVRELLEDWQPNSIFYNHLRHSINFGHLPPWFADSVKEKHTFWNYDPRIIRNKRLRSSFLAVKKSNSTFNSLIESQLWFGGPQNNMNFDYLAIPIEWDYKKRDAADTKLESARFELADNLDALFRLLHDQGAYSHSDTHSTSDHSSS